MSSPTPDAVAACAGQVEAALAQGRPVLLACDPSPEGVLAAVGVTYLAHAREGDIRLAGSRDLQPRFGEEVVRVPSDTSDETVTFARRVLKGVLFAIASDERTMPEVVHRYLRLGFSLGPAARERIADPHVAAFNDLVRAVLNECERTRQFVRFSHMSDGSYVATFSPKANTIPLTAGHFVARMGTERFCIVDPSHLVAAFHDPSRPGHELVRLDDATARDITRRDDFADDEAYVRTMWRRFYAGTTTPGRDRSQRGYDLRASWMPKRLWEGLTELGGQREGTVVVPARYQGEAALPSS